MVSIREQGQREYLRIGLSTRRRRASATAQKYDAVPVLDIRNNLRSLYRLTVRIRCDVARIRGTDSAAGRYQHHHAPCDIGVRQVNSRRIAIAHSRTGGVLNAA